MAKHKGTGARPFGDTIGDIDHAGQISDPPVAIPLADSQGKPIIRSGDASGPVRGVVIVDEPRRSVGDLLSQRTGQ